MTLRRRGLPMIIWKDEKIRKGVAEIKGNEYWIITGYWEES